LFGLWDALLRECDISSIGFGRALAGARSGYPLYSEEFLAMFVTIPHALARCSHRSWCPHQAPHTNEEEKFKSFYFLAAITICCRNIFSPPVSKIISSDENRYLFSGS